MSDPSKFREAAMMMTVAASAYLFTRSSFLSQDVHTHVRTYTYVHKTRRARESERSSIYIYIYIFT